MGSKLLVWLIAGECLTSPATRARPPDSAPYCAIARVGAGWVVSAPLLDAFQFDASAHTEASASLLDALQEPRIVFKSVVEPVVLRFESD